MQKLDGEILYLLQIIQHSREYMLIREIFREFFKKPRPSFAVDRFKYSREKKARRDRKSGKRRDITLARKRDRLQVCLLENGELSKGALCRRRVEKECLKRLYMRTALVKGLRGIGLCAELNMTVATAES